MDEMPLNKTDPSQPASAADPNDIVSGSGSGAWRSVAATIGILLAAPLVALMLTAFVFQSYEVDGPSMETTLQNHDRLVVWKTPRTLARVTNHAYIPHRGDVVIFIKRGLFESGNGKEKQLIKRVIGLPGDRLVLADGHYTIYNSAHPGGFNPDIDHDFSANIPEYTSGSIDTVIGPEQIFVSGDNRSNSLDSRAFGLVPTNDIIGKLTIRISPISKFKSFI